jgi:hypothetical protein
MFIWRFFISRQWRKNRKKFKVDSWSIKVISLPCNLSLFLLLAFCFKTKGCFNLIIVSVYDAMKCNYSPKKSSANVNLSIFINSMKFRSFSRAIESSTLNGIIKLKVMWLHFFCFEMEKSKHEGGKSYGKSLFATQHIVIISIFT